MPKSKFPWFTPGAPGVPGVRTRLLDSLPAVNQMFQQPPSYVGDKMFRKVRESATFGEMSKTVSSVHVNSVIECRKLYEHFSRDIQKYTEDGRVFTIYFSNEGICQTSILWFPRTHNDASNTFYVI
jgi:hypothetical protein